MSDHPIQCSCGQVRGTVSGTASFNRCICYCRTCQAFAHFLGRADEILDAAGGSDITQTQPSRITIDQGMEHIACMRLSEKGPLRWYTACCRTPIGNTASTCRLHFIGLLHNVFAEGGRHPNQSIGPVTALVHTDGARTSPQPQARGLAGAIFRIGRMIAGARLSGAYRKNPFFDTRQDLPIASPRVLSDGERQELYACMDAASQNR